MTINKKTVLTKAAPKNVNAEILDKLVSVLSGYKKVLGDKKFEKKLSKITKLFTKHGGKEKKAITKIPVQPKKAVRQTA